jgi:hypothetical protein
VGVRERRELWITTTPFDHCHANFQHSLSLAFLTLSLTAVKRLINNCTKTIIFQFRFGFFKLKILFSTCFTSQIEFNPYFFSFGFSFYAVKYLHSQKFQIYYAFIFIIS